jgi:hypothetical protein
LPDDGRARPRCTQRRSGQPLARRSGACTRRRVRPRLATLIIPTQFHSGGYTRSRLQMLRSLGLGAWRLGMATKPRRRHRKNTQAHVLPHQATTPILIQPSSARRDEETERGRRRQVCARGRRGEGGRPWPSARGRFRGVLFRALDRRNHGRARVLRRLRVPRVRRRHEGHHHAQPAAHLVHGGARAHVPRDDAPDQRDRRGESALAGRVDAEERSSVAMAEAEASSKPRRCRR